MHRRLLPAITVFLLAVIGVSSIVGEYYHLHEISGEIYTRPIRGVATRLPARPRDQWYPWIEPYFDDSVWHYEDLAMSVSVGVHKPGEQLELNYRITGAYEKRNLTIVYRLIQLGDTPTILFNKTDHMVGPPFGGAWRVRLPDQYPAEYRFGIVVYDDGGMILDGFVAPVTVPPQELLASMRVEPDAATAEENVVLVIHNEGQTHLLFGVIYNFDKLVDEEWKPVPSEYIWIMPLISVSPNGTYTQKMNIVGLDSGTYRVSKEVEAEGTNLNQTLYAQFTVSRPPEEPDEQPRWGYRISWSLAEESVESRDRPMLELVNLGMRRLYLNGSYALDLDESGAWKSVTAYEPAEPQRQTVEPGGVYKLIIGEAGMKPGRYRLSLDIGIEGTAVKKTLLIDFGYKD